MRGNHTTAGRDCAITVRIVGPADHEKWYTIWRQAAIVTKVCVYDRNKAGTAFALGEMTFDSILSVAVSTSS